MQGKPNTPLVLKAIIVFHVVGVVAATITLFTNRAAYAHHGAIFGALIEQDIKARGELLTPYALKLASDSEAEGAWSAGPRPQAAPMAPSVHASPFMSPASSQPRLTTNNLVVM